MKNNGLVMKVLAPVLIPLMMALPNCPIPDRVKHYEKTITKYIENNAENLVERQVILDAADRMIQLQNANGSWDWDVTNKTGPTAQTFLNIAGVNGEVLIDAFKLTNNQKYLDAAKKTGDHIIAGISALPAARHFNAFNMVFLDRLAESSGNTTYSNFVDLLSDISPCPE